MSNCLDSLTGRMVLTAKSIHLLLKKNSECNHLPPTSLFYREKDRLKAHLPTHLHADFKIICQELLLLQYSAYGGTEQEIIQDLTQTDT